MADKSIYERQHPTRQKLSSGIALGRIAAVDIDRRTCTVKTFFGADGLNDLSLDNVQWVNMDSNAEGDEFSIIPRPGSMGLVFFVEGEAFIFGSFNAYRGDKGAVTGKEVVKRLVQGDKSMSTRAGNYVTVRANGSIEFFSNDTLKRIFFPTDSRILEICQNLNLKAGGGYTNWEVDEILQTTLFTQEFRRDLARTIILVEQKGQVDSTTVFKQSIGPGLPGVVGVPAPSYEYSVDITGKATLKIGPPGAPTITQTISPDGSFEIDALSDVKINIKTGNLVADLVTGDITAKTSLGNISVEATQGNISAKTTAGDISVESAAGNVKAVATAGDMELEGSGGKLKLGKGKVGLGGPAAELVDQFIQFLTHMDTLLTAMQMETHVGNLGYNTAPPVNVADYISAQANIAVVKSMLETIKGGV